MAMYQGVLKNYLSIQDKQGTKICILCHQANVNELLHGPFQTYRNISAHFYCLLFASGLCQRGSDHDGIHGFLEPDILMECRRGSKLNCARCRKPGATVGCASTSCRRSYHFPCGVENKLLYQFFGEFRSYCNSHQAKQVIPSEYMVSKATCMICHEDLNTLPSFDALWAPCCKKTWFHRTCLQKLASNAGAFFKCPLCSNNSVFCCEMRHYGIFVVGHEPSWERDPMEFEQVVGTHMECGKEKCLCPKGRSYCCKKTRWELVHCSSCGSKSVHVGCEDLSFSKRKWDCNDCKPESRAAIGKEKTMGKPSQSNRDFLRKSAFKKTSASNLSRFDSPDALSDEASHDGAAHIGFQPPNVKTTSATRSVEKDGCVSTRAPVPSRNVARRGRARQSHPHYRLRFVVHEDSETQETWVWYGNNADELPLDPHKEALTLSKPSVCTGIINENCQKTIMLWCGKPWDLAETSETRQGKRP